MLLLGGMIVADLINSSIGVISNILVLVVFGSVWYFAFYWKVRKAKRASAT